MTLISCNMGLCR